MLLKMTNAREIKDINRPLLVQLSSVTTNNNVSQKSSDQTKGDNFVNC